MENPQSARGGTLASKRQTFNKKQFIQYEPDLVEELNDKKTKNQSVSGRLLTLLYKRLLFWSRYAKHQYKGRRYFWKSIVSLSEELQYSEKQVARGLKALVELGLIKREKLNKHNWKHHYYYYLPKSVHTAEPEAIRTSSSIRSNSSSSGSWSGRSRAVGQAIPPTPVSEAPGAPGRAVAGSRGTAVAPDGTAGSDYPQTSHTHISKVVPPPAGAVSSKGQHRTRHFESTIINRNTPLLENQLQTIVEKCLDYAINPPKPFTRGGIGFAT